MADEAPEENRKRPREEEYDEMRVKMEGPPAKKRHVEYARPAHPMNRLPPEVIQKVADRLDPDSVSQLRLASRVFANGIPRPADRVTNLPPELMVKIAELLPLEDRLQLRQTNKAIKEIVTETVGLYDQYRDQYRFSIPDRLKSMSFDEILEEELGSPMFEDRDVTREEFKEHYDRIKAMKNIMAGNQTKRTTGLHTDSKLHNIQRYNMQYLAEFEELARRLETGYKVEILNHRGDLDVDAMTRGAEMAFDLPFQLFQAPIQEENEIETHPFQFQQVSIERLSSALAPMLRSRLWAAIFGRGMATEQDIENQELVEDGNYRLKQITYRLARMAREQSVDRSPSIIRLNEIDAFFNEATSYIYDSDMRNVQSHLLRGLNVSSYELRGKLLPLLREELKNIVTGPLRKLHGVRRGLYLTNHP